MNAPSEIAYLRHMRDALRAIKEYTITGRSGFFASKMVQDAVVRNLEVLGEATKALSAEVRGHAPHVPWHYFGVDIEVVWRVVEVEVEPLLLVVERLITDLGRRQE